MLRWLRVFRILGRARIQMFMTTSSLILGRTWQGRDQHDAALSSVLVGLQNLSIGIPAIE